MTWTGSQRFRSIGATDRCSPRCHHSSHRIHSLFISFSLPHTTLAVFLTTPQYGEDFQRNPQGMLTRKQMWRRVRGPGRLAGERFGCAAPPGEPLSETPQQARPASSDDNAESRGRKVSFSFQVRVVLVPCTRDLRPLSAQLWWDAEDYSDFR